MEKYLVQLAGVDSLEALNAIIELAANDDALTNAEYTLIYNAALGAVRSV